MIDVILTVSPLQDWLLKQIPVVVVLGICVAYQTIQLTKTREKLDKRSEMTIANNIKFTSLIDRLISDVPSIKQDIKEDLKDLKQSIMGELKEIKQINK